MRSKKVLKIISNNIQDLYEKRKNKISDLMHKVSRHIVRYMLIKEIGTIVVGYNRGWKDSIRIGKRNNQTFVQIPYETLIGYLRYKCDVNGALNIMRNVFNDSARRIIDRGLLFNPVKLNDLWHLPQMA